MPPNPYQQNKVRGSASAVARVFFLRELKAKDAKRRAQVGTARRAQVSNEALCCITNCITVSMI